MSTCELTYCSIYNHLKTFHTHIYHTVDKHQFNRHKQLPPSGWFVGGLVVPASPMFTRERCKVDQSFVVVIIVSIAKGSLLCRPRAVGHLVGHSRKPVAVTFCQPPDAL